MSASYATSVSILKGKAIPRSECYLALRDACRQKDIGRSLAKMAASVQVDVQLRNPTRVCIQRKGVCLKTNTYTLSMFSQCQYCNISTFIMEMHWGFSSSLKRGIWRQSCTADKHQANLQIKFWHICLDLQMSGREFPFPWMCTVSRAVPPPAPNSG